MKNEAGVDKARASVGMKALKLLELNLTNLQSVCQKIITTRYTACYAMKGITQSIN